MTLAGWTLSFLRPYRARVAAIVALSLLEIGLAALAPWPLKAVVDNVLGGHPLPPLVAGAGARRSRRERRRHSWPSIVVAGLLLQLASELVLMAHTQLQVDTGAAHRLRPAPIAALAPAGAVAAAPRRGAHGRLASTASRPTPTASTTS